MNPTYNYVTQAAYRPPAAGHIAVAGPVSMGELDTSSIPARLERLATVIREEKIADDELIHVNVFINEIEVQPACGRRLGIEEENDGMRGKGVISGVTFRWQEIPF